MPTSATRRAPEEQSWTGLLLSMLAAPLFLTCPPDGNKRASDPADAEPDSPPQPRVRTRSFTGCLERSKKTPPASKGGQRTTTRSPWRSFATVKPITGPYDTMVLEPSQQPRALVVVIPGNPGMPVFYTGFGEHLCTRLCAEVRPQPAAPRELAPSNRSQPSELHGEDSAA